MLVMWVYILDHHITIVILEGYMFLDRLSMVSELNDIIVNMKNLSNIF